MAHFSSPPDPRAYNAQVWQMVRMVPPGFVATYGQIAQYIPPPAGMDMHEYLAMSPRWVGRAMAGCPNDVPWQRIVNSQGKISLDPGSGGQVQRGLLEAEGIEFDEKGRIDLGKYRWDGPAEFN